jgi:hypothetical protein
LRRSHDLVIEALGDELLVYDRTNTRAHCLSADAVRVWHACDGSSDARALSAGLGLALDVVRQALDELEASALLDHGIELIDVAAGNGRSVTRRQLAVRSAKMGTAVATAPLILSIAAPTAMAAATPTPFQCEVYTVSDCGVSTGCGAVAGCCCCCQGSSGNCKLCSSTSVCQAGIQPCSQLLGGGISHCSTIGIGLSPSAQGCCGITGANLCGCGFSSTGVPGTGGPNGGSGCCDTSSPVNGVSGPPFNACVPGATGTCVPCCNGTPLGPSSTLLCCVAGPTTTCPTV